MHNRRQAAKVSFRPHPALKLSKFDGLNECVVYINEVGLLELGVFLAYYLIDLRIPDMSPTCGDLKSRAYH